MRKDWIDSLKGILIFLVVVGHVVGMAAHLSSGFEREVYSYIYKFIYLFHMPAFFFVAGLVWKRKDIGFGAFVRNKFKRLMVSYYIWGALSILVFYFGMGLMSGVRESSGYYGDAMFDKTILQSFLSLLHAGGWPDGEGFRYNSVLWFLPCMFTVQLAFYWLDRVVRKKHFLVVVALLLFVLGGCIRIYQCPALPFGLSLMPRYLGFMVLGVVFSSITVNLSGRIVRTLFILSLMIFGGIVSLLPQNMYIVNEYWSWYTIELGLAIGGIMLSYECSKVCNLTARAWKLLGVNSLVIMLAHKFIVTACMAIEKKIMSMYVGVSVVVVTVVAIAVSCLAAIVIRKYLPEMIGEKR